nr:tetratricopeptide repeat protein [uncultured Carboxylicivirga sp.]
MKSYFKSSSVIALLCTMLFLLISGIKAEAAPYNMTQEDSLVTKLKNTQEYSEKMDILFKLSTLSRGKDYKKSLEYSNKGFTLADSFDDDINCALFKLESGLTTYFLGDYKETLELYFYALRIFERHNHSIGIIRTLSNLGAVYDRVEAYNKAIVYYNKCIAYFNEMPLDAKQEYLKYLSQVYNNLASAYEKLNNNQEANLYYKKALDVGQSIDYPQIVGSIYNNLGKLEAKNQNYDSAKDYLSKAINIREEINDTEGLAKSYYFLSDYYNKTNQIDSAEWAALQSLKLAEDKGLLESQQIAHMFLYEIYEKKAQPYKALAEHKLYKQLSDSLLNEQRMSQIAQLQISYELDKVEEEAEMDKERMKFSFIIVLVILFAILVVAILGLIIYRKQKTKIKLENKNLELEIDTKNKELTTNVMYLVQKNELINSVAKSLLLLKQNVSSENQLMIQKIVQNLNAESDGELWNEFEYRFQMVHTEFYKKLRSLHSNITPSEERLAALLRLNLSSKEVSTITHQTIRSIEVARGRLRKKLNLTGTDINLVTYLAEL